MKVSKIYRNFPNFEQSRKVRQIAYGFPHNPGTSAYHSNFVVHCQEKEEEPKRHTHTTNTNPIGVRIEIKSYLHIACRRLTFKTNEGAKFFFYYFALSHSPYLSNVYIYDDLHDLL